MHTEKITQIRPNYSLTNCSQTTSLRNGTRNLLRSISKSTTPQARRKTTENELNKSKQDKQSVLPAITDWLITSCQPVSCYQ